MPAERRRAAIAVLVVVALGVVAFVGFRIWSAHRPDPRQADAVAHCEDTVRGELSHPAQAQFTDVDARTDIVTEDDHVALGFDASKVAAMWGVVGTIASPGREGEPETNEFLCRAALFEDGSVRSWVTGYRDLDLAGQLDKSS